MITQFIISIFFGIPKLFISPLPALPSLPAGLSTATDTVLDVITSVISVLQFIYTPVLLNGIFAMVVAFMLFEVGYTAIIWVLTKIPIFGVNR